MIRSAAVCLALVSTASAEIAAPETTEVFTGTGSTVVELALAKRFLLSGTESVRRGHEALAVGSGYRLEPDAGILVLMRPLAEGERVEITYSWVPLDLPAEFVAVEPGQPTPADSVRMAAPSASAADRIARVVDEDLVIGGAKTLSIEAGSNKDAAVEQSLRVSVTGHIGDDVNLTALLSDQNIPLQPEGNTQRLEELDEVLIRLDAPRGSATLGDFVARREGTAFGDFERRLSGAEGRAKTGPANARAVGASSRGTFRTAEFRGEEGKQGPYVLAGSGLNPTGVIVAGSEQVWLDGRLLTRGDAHDYVIDYSRGEIEFTNRRLITEDSEIAIDFEVAEQEYGRNFYLGEGGFESGGGGLVWRASIASEVDDQDPLNVTLSEERKQALAAAGDSTVLVSGIECGEDGGDYVPVADHFVYFKDAGADSGTCAVSFTFRGTGAGDYVRDRDLDTGLTYYRFVGAALGDYTPGVLLGAPRTTTLADMGIRAKAGDRFELEADGAASRDDRNSLSDLDDGDNDGAAGRMVLAYERSRFRAQTSFRREEAEFRSLGRTRDVYLGETWNFADTTRADESVGEVTATLAEPERWSLGGSLGVLDRADRFRSSRREGRASWRSERIPSASFRLESVEREDEADTSGTVVGDLLRTRGEVTGRAGRFEPGVDLWSERRQDARGDSRLGGEYDIEGGGRLGFRPASSVRTDVRFARRVTDVVESGEWTRQSVGRTWEVRGEADPGRSMRARVSWIRRELDFAPGRPETDRTTHLARADLAHESFAGLVNGEYVYEATSRFFTDLLAVDTAAEEPTIAVNASARLRVGGTRARRSGESAPASSFTRALAIVGSETVFRVEEETTSEDRGAFYRLELGRFQDDDHTVFGKILVREEITLFPGAGPFSLTARWERIDTEDNRGDPERVELLTERTVLRARNSLSPRWTLETQSAWDSDRRSDSGTGSVQFDVRRTELREEVVFQPRPTTRVSGIGTALFERNEANDARAEGLVIGAATSFAVLRQGRLRGEVDWTHPLSFEGSDLGDRFRTKERDQIEWQAGFEARVSEWINASISYSGRALEGLPTTHLARAEMRALF
jgi:hypothetical protein